MPFTPETIARHGPVPGLSIQVLEEVTSTNTLLGEMAREGAPEGTVLAARRQTAGRGRRDRSFFSPADTGLYLSFLLRPDLPAREALLLTTCAASAAARAIEEVAGVPTGIKWVNDLVCGGKKVAGILTEGAMDPATGGLLYAVVGIGVNLVPPPGGFPADLPQAGAVLESCPDLEDLRSRLAGAILTNFFAHYPDLGAKPFFADYKARSLVLGRPITILEGAAARPAVALDLEADFSLRVREADGTVRTLSSGEVSIRPE